MPAEPADEPPTPADDEIDVGDPEHEEIAGDAADDPDAFLTLMSHLYRGTLDRATKWRDRLDRTVHWSVLVVASLLTWTFSSPDRPHAILPLGMIILTVFLWIEARRYLFFDVWRSQVRVLEENVFAHALDPRGVEEDDWRRLLSEDLRRPAFKISPLEAVVRRLRRIYLPLLLVMLVAWLLRLAATSPTPSQIPTAASVWKIPGPVIVGLVALFYSVLIGLTVWPIDREAKGHIRDREDAVDLTKEP